MLVSVPVRACRLRLFAPVLAAGLLVGCAAGQAPEPSPRPSVSATSAPSIAPDGVTLGQLGFTHGPLDAFSIPRGSQLITVVDQPNVVTLAIEKPDYLTLGAYLRTALPLAGFALEEDQQRSADLTITFAGHGWTGVFTGAAGTSAVTLRPR